ncbi:hypothetical protein, partial [Vibrio azureus]
QILHLSVEDWIQAKFVEGFGTKWIYKVLPSTWIQAISTMSVTEIRRAMSQVLLKGDAWPPSIPEFINMGREVLVDVDEAFTRMLHGVPKGDIEYWASQEIGFICRTQLREREARAKHRKVLNKYAEKARAGTLPARNSLRLVDKTNVKPISEITRPDPSMFEKDSVFARVAAMGARA